MTGFTVENALNITGRGPLIVSSRDEALQRLEAGEIFETGQVIHCGDLVARITGIEYFPVVDTKQQPQQSMLVRGVELEQLEIGQVWTG